MFAVEMCELLNNLSEHAGMAITETNSSVSIHLSNTSLYGKKERPEEHPAPIIYRLFFISMRYHLKGSLTLENEHIY